MSMKYNDFCVYKRIYSYNEFEIKKTIQYPL